MIGAGGPGTAALPYLASAGVGTITVVDDDAVDLTNLQRQILHTTASIGRAKVESAREGMLRINPGIAVRTVAARVGEAELAALAAEADVVLDCCDNFTTRQAVNRACVRHRVPLVSGAALRFDGRSVCSTAASTMRPATPACSRRRNLHRRWHAPPWACSRRWSAWWERYRRLKR